MSTKFTNLRYGMGFVLLSCKTGRLKHHKATDTDLFVIAIPSEPV